jgi:hypothetical protein
MRRRSTEDKETAIKGKKIQNSGKHTTELPVL